MAEGTFCTLTIIIILDFCNFEIYMRPSGLQKKQAHQRNYCLWLWVGRFWVNNFLSYRVLLISIFLRVGHALLNFTWCIAVSGFKFVLLKIGKAIMNSIAINQLNIIKFSFLVVNICGLV